MRAGTINEYLCSKTILTVANPEITPEFPVEVNVLRRASVNIGLVLCKKNSLIESFNNYK